MKGKEKFGGKGIDRQCDFRFGLCRKQREGVVVLRVYVPS
jgi:hypothetical protein